MADLFAYQELIDRRAALSFLTALLAGMSEPDLDDIAGPGSVLSRPAADAVVRRVQSGDIAAIWTGSEYDLSALAEAPFSGVFSSLGISGADVRLVLPTGALEGMDDAARAGLRNASFRHGFTLWTANPIMGLNGATLLAAISTAGTATGFFSRDGAACVLGPGWGAGSEHPLVEMPLATFPQMLALDADALERSTALGDRVRIIQSDPGRPVKQFGAGMVSRVLKADLEAAGLWKPGQLAAIGYSDRYLKAPLPVLLMFRTVAALRDALAPKGVLIPFDVVTEPLRDDRYGGAPFKIGNNWQNEGDRADVVEALAGRLRLQCRYDDSYAPHGRKMKIRYDDGTVAVILFDQGFGYWRATSSDRHDFRAGPERQAGALLDASTFVAGVGESYVAVTRS